MKELFTYLPCHLALEIANHSLFYWHIGKTYTVAETKSKSSECINQAFHWSSTDEGGDYWSDLYYKYEKRPYISNLKYLL